MGGLLISTLTLSAVESGTASGASAVRRDKAGTFERGRVAMEDGNELTVLARGDDIVAAMIGSPGTWRTTNTGNGEALRRTSP
jgi:hypothetical protein